MKFIFVIFFQKAFINSMYFILFSFVLFLLCWSVYDEGLYADLAAGLRAYR